MTIKIGIDFDNTIACYDAAFFQAALEKNLIPQTLDPSKSSIRNYLREAGKEELWTELQGYIYGARMDLALPFPGVEVFFQNAPYELAVISHKTIHPYKGPRYNLHEAAKSWLKKFPSLAQASAFFELTLAEKLRRISLEKCAIFIDDLPELLFEREFPAGVAKILFDPHRIYPENSSYKKAASWKEVKDIVRELADG